MAWRDIPSFEGLYRASDEGEIFSVRRGHLLKPSVADGRPLVVLCKDGCKLPVRVCRVVLLAFVGSPRAGQECCHNDGDPMNNRLDNLRWDTRKGNFADRDRHGTTARGERQGAAKLTEVDVRWIRHLSRRGASQRKIAARFGMSQSTIGSIVRREYWRHVA